MSRRQAHISAFLKLLLLAVFIIAAGLLIFFAWFKRANSSANSKDKETKLFEIPQGWGVNQIAQALKSKGLIKNKYAFKLLTYKEDLTRNLQAGSFYLSPSMTGLEILQQLMHGTTDLRITIPEGLRREEIARRVSQEFSKAGDEFDGEEFILKSKAKEGFLFPDTYLIPKGATADKIVEILENNFEKKYSAVWKDTFLTKNQIITLASLVEREAKREEDRFIVAGILIKRLKAGWPLQVDASIQYAVASLNCQDWREECDWWPKGLSKQDLKIKSEYNTYTELDLPPMPICNPGLSAIKAALKPTQSEYWYYLSDQSGKIYYSKTLQEHEQNINKHIN